MIAPSDRCSSISELFNETFLAMSLIRRIKYYHLPCQNQSSQLSCFYDDMHMCLCSEHDGQRSANCFEIDHNMKYDCDDHSECQNGGVCFQQTDACSKGSICICPPDFYGSRCQFLRMPSNTGLTLNGILKYHIFLHIALFANYL